MVKKHLHRVMNQVEHLQRLVIHLMADQGYESLDILRKNPICFPCGFDGSGKSAALMR